MANGWLAQWNSSRVVWETAGFGPSQSGTIDASTPNRYDWNATIQSTVGNIPTSATIRAAFIGDTLLVSNIAPAYSDGTFTIWGTIDPYTVAAISLKPTTRGQVLWRKTYTAPNNLTRQWAGADPVNRVFVMKDVETMTWTAYSMDDGSKVWGPTPSQPDYDYFNLQSFIAYDRMYSSGYVGKIFAYSIKNGSLLWTFGGNNEEGNNTFAGLTTAWGNYPTFIMAVAGGKLYTSTYEHSPNSPHYKGMRIRAVDAYTGREIWNILGAGSAFEMGSKAFAVASGFTVWLNAYDMQLYVAGRGPSATTVSASPEVSVHGSSVLVKGTVTDVSPGTKSDVLAMRFPHGVPAVSDASMSAWMLYVYKQFPRPMDAVGVDVILSVLDPNGNVYDIGTATTDASGFYSFLWEPLVPGKYTIFATFAGSKGYYASFAETAIGVEEAPTATPPPTPPPAPMTDTYVTGFGIGIILAIVIGFALLLFKKQ